MGWATDTDITVLPGELPVSFSIDRRTSERLQMHNNKKPSPGPTVPGATRATLVFATGLSLAGLRCIMVRLGRRSMETVVMASRRLLGAANWPAVCTSGSYFIEGPRQLSLAGAARCETREVSERGELSLSFSLAVPPSGS